MSVPICKPKNSSGISRRGLMLVASASLILPARAKAASDYPQHPIQFFVPFTPGGGADTLARLVATPQNPVWLVGSARDTAVGDEIDRQPRPRRVAAKIGRLEGVAIAVLAGDDAGPRLKMQNIPAHRLSPPASP